MKKLLFVSTGRCGTKRIAQILRECLPEEFSVTHQMPFSRFANLVGNLFYYLRSSEKIKCILYNLTISRYSHKRHFICSDPLTSMIIPNLDIRSEDVCIVHIVRDPNEFAESFFRLTRRRIRNFIAHNFIPLWQPGIWPFENLLNRNIKEKYIKIAKLKNTYFTKNYSSNPNYIKIDMSQIFASDFLTRIISDFFCYKVIIPGKKLSIKAN